MRIVSLLPSATEIVAALGFRDELAGRSHECDYPEWVRDLPALTRPAFEAEGGSAGIDRKVNALLAKALSLYEVDVEKLRTIDPDFIVTQSQCEVCAVSEAELERALADWVGHRARILSLKPDALEDVWRDILAVARALGVAERGKALVGQCRNRIREITRRIPAASRRPKIACIEWLEPLMGAGNWMPELAALAGGEPLFGKKGEHSPLLSWNQLKAGDPD
ncbi:MAG: ABC transporter substrate-binding protein, partial [Candidatus Binatia bacterium]